MRPLVTLFFVAIVLFAFPYATSAQNDLQVDYLPGGIPERLNVCGLPDTAVIHITTAGLNPNPRTAITAQAVMAGGIRIVALIPGASTPGVQLTAGAGTGIGQFAIPDLDPAGTSEAVIALLIQADCAIVDSLNNNPSYDLMDTWTVDYTLQGNNYQVSMTLNSYRAALRIPDFIVSPQAVSQKVKPGDCITRTVQITNTGLDAYVLSLQYGIQTTAGLSYKAIRVNGTDIPLTKTVSGTDTLIRINIPGTVFVNNTATNGNPGNADTLFDANEVITIEEDLCVVNCTDSYQTTHTASYGCFDVSCQNFSAAGDLTPGQGNNSVSFDTNTATADQNVGYCQVGISAMKITNTGVAIDPGFADILNVKAGIGLGFPTSMSHGGYTITSVTIQGVTVTDTNLVHPLHGNPAFTSDPDGPGGLADLDGDGYFDDLPAGESIEVVAFYDYNCSNGSPSANCDTAFSTRLSAFFEYEDVCGNSHTESRTNYKTILNQLVVVENYVTPDADAGTGDVFYVSHQHDRRIFNFDKGCANGHLYARIALPPGIQFDSTNTTLTRGVLTHPITGTAQNGDTLTILFDPGPLESLNGQYHLNLALTATCAAADGQLTLYGEFGFICEDCNCEHVWYCATIPGTYIHVKNPPCPSAPICDNTIRTDAMDMSRTTFGFADTAYTIPIDPNVADAKNALNCDTMRMTIEGVAGAAFSGQDIGIDVSYANPLYLDGTDEIFQYGRGYLEVKSGGSVTTCEIPKSALTVTAVDPKKFLDFNLLNSLQTCGLTIQPGDSVKAYLFFHLNDDGPYSETYYLVPELRGGFYTNASNKLTCGNYGDEVKIGKNRALVAGPSSADLPKGCDTTYLTYKIIPINNGYSIINPIEHRPSVAIDSIVFNYEPLLLNGFSGVQVQASIKDHPVFGDSYFDVGTLDSTGHFAASFDTLTQYISMTKLTDYAVAIRLMLLPNCEAENGSINGDPTFDFDVNMYYKQNYHVFNISGGACVKDTIYNNPNDITYSNPPAISLQNLGLPTEVSVGDSITWTIRQCNSTNFADAKVTWLSVEDINPGLNIISIEDITDPNNIINLPLNNIPSGGVYVNTNPLLRNVNTNTSDDICNVLRIAARMTDCDTVTANIKSGWNCSTFDPLAHPFCTKQVMAIAAKANPPLLSVIQQPGLPDYAFCDTVPITLEIKNTQGGDYFNMLTTLTLPPHTQFIPGSFEVAWPPSAGFVPLGADPIYTGSTIMGDQYTLHPFDAYNYLQANGLPHFNTASPSDSNSIHIRYRIITDCDYVSGRTSELILTGEEFCGDPTDTTGFVTFPVFITGSPPDPANQYQLDITVSDTISGTFPVHVNITNVGDSISGPNDKIQILLSAGISYVTGSASANNWSPGEPAITMNNGITTLEWTLPPGMTKNTSQAFDFILSSLDIGCGSAGFQLGFTTIRETQQFCATTGANCTVGTPTGELKVFDLFKQGSPTVTIDASISDTLCAHQPVTLIANGTTDITWISLPTGDTIATGSPATFIPDLGITTLIATATGDTCSVSHDSLQVTVLESPQVSLPQDTTIFEGDTIQISGTLMTNIPTTIQWSPTAYLSDTTIADPFAYPPATTTYVLTATGNTGCVATDSIQITVVPKVDTLPCPVFYINQDSVHYTVVCGLPMDFPLPVNADSLANYQIYVDGADVTGQINAGTDSIGVYDLTGINGQTGPFDIQWDFNDSTYQATAPDLSALLTQLNVWDTFGNWYFDDINEQLHGGAAFHQYGDLHISNGNGFDLQTGYGTSLFYGLSTISLTAGTHQIIAFNTQQVCADTLTVTASCENYNPGTNNDNCIARSIYIDETVTYCYDPANLPGQLLSMTNLCDAHGNVEYTFSDTTFCIEYKGLEIGTDSACVQFCDEYGLCDTVNFCTSVIPYDGLPLINDDSTCTYMNTPTVVNILANDSTWGGIDTIYLVNDPLSGHITLNPDLSVTYTPDPDVCERTDQIQYIVCNDNGCDDGFINICILCDDIVVFTAMSPNGDGVNDYFYISNIKKFPDSEVEIYNRWGNRVFRGKGYQNDWGGNWVHNTVVPDGTYYYIIRLNDDGHRIFKGYLQIHR